MLSQVPFCENRSSACMYGVGRQTNKTLQNSRSPLLRLTFCLSQIFYSTGCVDAYVCLSWRAHCLQRPQTHQGIHKMEDRINMSFSSLIMLSRKRSNWGPNTLKATFHQQIATAINMLPEGSMFFQIENVDIWVLGIWNVTKQKMQPWEEA